MQKKGDHYLVAVLAVDERGDRVVVLGLGIGLGEVERAERGGVVSGIRCCCCLSSLSSCCGDDCFILKW